MFRRIALSWIRFTASCRKFLHVGKMEEEIADELLFHLQNEIEMNVKAGMTPEEACYAALRGFGGVEQIKEQCRDIGRFRFIEDA